MKVGEKRAEKKAGEKKEPPRTPVPPLPPNLNIINIQTVIPPYTHVAITKDEEGKFGYMVIEPSLTQSELDLINRLREILN